jgi:anti-anti-sigma factor
MMEFTVSPIDEVTNMVVMRGRLDVAGCNQIELPFTAAVTGAGRHAALDLSQVEFVGSLGLRMLISVARVLQRRDRKVAIFGAPDAVREVFETVALNELIPVFAGEAEARAYLGK